MKKKLLSLALAGALALGVTGCGTGGNESAKDSQTSQQTAEFNPSQETDVLDIKGVRAKYGEEVPVAANLKLGAVAKSFTNEFWRNFKNGYDHVAEVIQAAGINIEIKVDGTTDEGDEIGQQAMADNLVNQKYNALLLSPISDSNLTATVDNAKAAGIPVFNVNDAVISQSEVYIGPDAYGSGKLAAEWVSKQLGGQGEVAIVIGMPKSFAARYRTAGFKDWITENNSGLKVVAEQNADWDRQKAKELASAWIQQNPNLKAVFCNNDGMALGVVEAVKEAGANILVIGVDGIGEAHDSIKAGGLDATVDYFDYYMSQVAAEVALRQLAGQDMPRVVRTPQAVIDKTNVNSTAIEILGWTDAKYVAK